MKSKPWVNPEAGLFIAWSSLARGTALNGFSKPNWCQSVYCTNLQHSLHRPPRKSWWFVDGLLKTQPHEPKLVNHEPGPVCEEFQAPPSVSPDISRIGQGNFSCHTWQSTRGASLKVRLGDPLEFLLNFVLRLLVHVPFHDYLQFSFLLVSIGNEGFSCGTGPKVSD